MNFLTQEKIKFILLFFAVTLITILLFQSLDSGLINYYENMAYLKREGVSLAPLILIKFIFTSALVFALMAKSKIIRNFFYFF